MRHTVQKALIAAAATLAFAAAQAAPVATWQTTSGSGVFSNTASFVAAGVTASDLTGTVPVGQQSGYISNGANAWSVAGSGAVANASFTLTLTTSTALSLSTFDFTLFNNDCQVDGTPTPKCTNANWGVQYAINGGGFSSDLLSFNAGAPYANTAESVALNQTLNAGDSLTMRVYAIDNGSAFPGSGQYFFHSISLNTPAGNNVPEPGTLALTGLALLAATRLRRKA